MMTMALWSRESHFFGWVTPTIGIAYQQMLTAQQPLPAPPGEDGEGKGVEG